MNKTNLLSGNILPEAHVCVNKNRVKTYRNDDNVANWNSVVYLKDGSTFQLEIFNPLNITVMAKVKFNGHNVDGNVGLVVKPGERIFLERFLSVNKKFLFTTYNINNNDEAAKTAIANNGLIEIDFYPGKDIFFTTPVDNVSQPFYTYSTGGKLEYYAYSTNSLQTCIPTPSNSEIIETGRISQGEVSGQKFNKVNNEFYSFTFHNVKFKLLPISNKPFTKEDVIKHRNYCSNCGKKVRAKDKYCSNCGQKL